MPEPVATRTHRRNQQKKSAEAKREKGRSSNYRSHKVQEKQEDSNTDSSEDGTFKLRCMEIKLGRMSEVRLRKVDPYTVSIRLNGKCVTLEIDTGCSLTVMNEKTFQTMFQGAKTPRIRQVQIKLETYTGHPVKVSGAAHVRVKYMHQSVKLPIIVVERDGPSLLGRHTAELEGN